MRTGESVELGVFRYFPSERDPYDPRFMVAADIRAAIDLSPLSAGRRRRFCAEFVVRLNSLYPRWTTTGWHDCKRRRFVLKISLPGPAIDFTPADFRRLRSYRDDVQSFCQPVGVAFLTWTAAVEADSARLYLEIPEFMSTGLAIALCTRRRNYITDLYLAIASNQDSNRYIGAAYRKNPIGAIAHITHLAPGCPFQLRFAAVLTDLIHANEWEIHACRAILGPAARQHLRAAWRLDREKTILLGIHCSADFLRSARRRLPAAFGNAVKRVHPEIAT